MAKKRYIGFEKVDESCFNCIHLTAYRRNTTLHIVCTKRPEIDYTHSHDFDSEEVSRTCKFYKKHTYPKNAISFDNMNFIQ